MKALSTPKKKEKKKLTEDEQRERLEELKQKRAKRCAEMGVGAKKIPVGNIMEGLKTSVKRIKQEVKSSEVLSNYFCLSHLFSRNYSCLLVSTVLMMS